MVLIYKKSIGFFCVKILEVDMINKCGREPLMAHS